jgi:hypothetical protein
MLCYKRADCMTVSSEFGTALRTASIRKKGGLLTSSLSDHLNDAGTEIPHPWSSSLFLYRHIIPTDSDPITTCLLLPWKMLGSKWIAVLIIADSAVVVTLVVVTCVIGFHRFAVSMNELLVKIEVRHLPHGDFLSIIRQKSFGVLDSLRKTIFGRLHGELRSHPAFDYDRCGELHRLITFCVSWRSGNTGPRLTAGAIARSSKALSLKPSAYSSATLNSCWCRWFAKNFLA